MVTKKGVGWSIAYDAYPFIMQTIPSCQQTSAREIKKMLLVRTQENKNKRTQMKTQNIQLVYLCMIKHDVGMYR